MTKYPYENFIQTSRRRTIFPSDCLPVRSSVRRRHLIWTTEFITPVHLFPPCAVQNSSLSGIAIERVADSMSQHLDRSIARVERRTLIVAGPSTHAGVSPDQPKPTTRLGGRVPAPRWLVVSLAGARSLVSDSSRVPLASRDGVFAIAPRRADPPSRRVGGFCVRRAHVPRLVHRPRRSRVAGARRSRLRRDPLLRGGDARVDVDRPPRLDTGATASSEPPDTSHPPPADDSGAAAPRRPEAPGFHRARSPIPRAIPSTFGPSRRRRRGRRVPGAPGAPHRHAPFVRGVNHGRPRRRRLVRRGVRRARPRASSSSSRRGRCRRRSRLTAAATPPSPMRRAARRSTAPRATRERSKRGSPRDWTDVTTFARDYSPT